MAISQLYNSFKKKVNVEIDWGDNATTTIRGMLVTASYSFNVDTHEFASDIAGEVISDGYIAGGELLVNRDIKKLVDRDSATFDADDVWWYDVTVIARGLVVYKDTGDPLTSPLLCYLDFGLEKQTNIGDFQVRFHSWYGVFEIF